MIDSTGISPGSSEAACYIHHSDVLWRSSAGLNKLHSGKHSAPTGAHCNGKSQPWGLPLWLVHFTCIACRQGVELLGHTLGYTYI